MVRELSTEMKPKKGSAGFHSASVSQKVRFVFTCFLQLQKFLWLLLRHHPEEFHERKRDFLTSVVSLLLRVVLCTLRGTLSNSSLLLPQTDFKSWAQKEWKYLYKYFMDSSGLISIFAKGCRILHEAYVKTKLSKAEINLGKLTSYKPKAGI